MQRPFMEALADGGLVGDGAMGSLLYERGIYINRSFDEANLSQPDLVYRIHREYLEAGALVLETNTYGASSARLARHDLGDKVRAINLAAVEHCQRAADGAAYVAASLGPSGLGDGATDAALGAVFGEQAAILAEGGPDLFLLETFASPRELLAAVAAVRGVCTLPIIAQMRVRDDGTPFGEASLIGLASALVAAGADAVGVNCNDPPSVLAAATALAEAGHVVSAFPNAGRPESIEDRLIHLATPENFGVFARRLFKAGVKLVGGCCGTTPSHIRRVAAAARMISPVTRAESGPAIEVREGEEPVPLADRSRLGLALGHRFVTSVEVNPGRGLTCDRQVEAVRMLRKAGADFINIADGPRATVRMSNLALGLVLERETDAEVLLHVCCRDRNLMGLQASVLGYHALGIRNLVVITGDPPKLGDYPDATAVYDVDSIGLLRIIDGFNRGLDPVGQAMDQTHFVLATGVEPAAVDFDREMHRLHLKIQAGANLVMTQPVYDPRHLDRFLEATVDLDVPVLVGILPLASYRNAEFLHHHVPGMAVPRSIRDRMRKVPSGPEARDEGIAIALEALRGVATQVDGAYIMPPLGRYDMAAAIVSEVKRWNLSPASAAGPASQ